MTKYDYAVKSIQETGFAQMKCFGNSMTPILKSGSLLRFQGCTVYSVGDIVLCKVRGRWIDAHKVIKINPDKGYLIANNHGHENGWTKKVYGKVIEILS